MAEQTKFHNHVLLTRLDLFVCKVASLGVNPARSTAGSDNRQPYKTGFSEWTDFQCSNFPNFLIEFLSLDIEDYLANCASRDSKWF